jgi:lipopolysaccharide/colanic/teichoic acid biosynthesis glycosyltransferase
VGNTDSAVRAGVFAAAGATPQVLEDTAVEGLEPGIVIDLRDGATAAGPDRGVEATVHVLPFGDGGKLGRADSLDLAVKRAIDIAVTSMALLMLLPVFVVTALAVKLSSPGPVLHRQVRIGRNGVPFGFLKFRSMYIDAEMRKAQLTDRNEAVGPIFKIKSDPRITPVGRVIRKLSVDELPQLFHVLSGRMTLVGPRPHLPEEVEAYDGSARRRLAVKPGITGIWQVSGRSDLDFATWIALDIEYLDTWSNALDLKLLTRTVGAVLSGRGAY